MCDPTKLSLSDAASLLRDIHNDAVRKSGPIDFVHKIRTPKNDLSGKYSIKQADLEALFSDKVWKDIKVKSGHRKLIHRVTHHVIEFGNHEKDIDPGAVLTIMDTVQRALNFLGNEVFEGKGWKEEPDYEISAKRWMMLFLESSRK